MNIDIRKMTIEISLKEMNDIIKTRQKFARMSVVMDSGKTNPLCVHYNEGVDMMAKYMVDYFASEFSKKQFNAWNEGGEK